MLKLTEKYAEKPAAELPMLFQRILQNTIHDHFRRQKVRNTWTTLLSALGKGDEKDDDFDPLETLAAKSDSNFGTDPAGEFEQRRIIASIEQALERLHAFVRPDAELVGPAEEPFGFGPVSGLGVRVGAAPGRPGVPQGEGPGSSREPEHQRRERIGLGGPAAGENREQQE